MAYVLILLAFLGCLTGAYLKGEKQGENNAIATQAKIATELENHFAANQKAVVSAIENIQVVNKTIVQRTVDHISQNPVYINCHNAPDVLRDINSALANPSTNPDTTKHIETSMPGINPHDRR